MDRNKPRSDTQDASGNFRRLVYRLSSFAKRRASKRMGRRYEKAREKRLCWAPWMEQIRGHRLCERCFARVWSIDRPAGCINPSWCWRSNVRVWVEVWKWKKASRNQRLGNDRRGSGWLCERLYAKFSTNLAATDHSRLPCVRTLHEQTESRRFRWSEG